MPWALPQRSPPRPCRNAGLVCPPPAAAGMENYVQAALAACTDVALTYDVSPHSRLLGRGTFGKVLLAQTREGQEKHALKFVSKVETCQELETLLLLKPHPNIVRFLGVFNVVDENPKYTHALAFSVADMDLKEFLQRRGALNTCLTGDILMQLATGLVHIHEAGIVHRDVKPANVLMTLSSNTAASAATRGLLQFCVQLTDFGNSRPLPRGTRTTTKTPQMKQGQQFVMTVAVCTFWYRAPELTFADPEAKTTVYGTGVDVWSWGSIAWELLMGKPLARAENDVGCVSCWLGALGSIDPEALYSSHPRCKQLVDAAAEVPPRRSPMPDGVWWEQVRQALRWDPRKRPSMQDLLSDCQTLTAVSQFGAQVQHDAAATEQDSTAATRGGAAADALAAAGESDVQGPQEPVRPERPVPSRWFSAWTKEPTVQRCSKKCACSGHCKTAGHSRHGCKSHMLLVASEYCVSCKCCVPDCPRPKHESELCHGHKKLQTALPAALRLTRASRHASVGLMPCDVTDFASKWAVWKEDLALIVLAAMLKEPTATAALAAEAEAFRGQPSTASQLRGALEGVARSLHGCPNDSEVTQLSRQGGRIFV